jgi:hypothetical protein
MAGGSLDGKYWSGGGAGRDGGFKKYEMERGTAARRTRLYDAVDLGYQESERSDNLGVQGDPGCEAKGLHDAAERTGWRQRVPPWYPRSALTPTSPP